MRILLVSPTFPPRSFGGMTEASYNLAKSLVERGHSVTVYTTDVNDSRSRLPDGGKTKKIDGIPVHYFKNISNLLASKRLYLPIGMITAVKRYLKDFDIVHLNEFRSIQSIIIHHYAKKYCIPYVLQAHGSVGTYFQKGLIKKLFDILWGKRILRDAACVFALTSVESNQYLQMGIDKDKIETVPNGVNLADYENLPQKGEFRKKYGLSDSEKILLFLARINEIKGPDLLINSFTRRIRKTNGVKLVIAGPDEGFMSVLRKLTGGISNSEDILFVGPLYGRDKLEAYVDADIYILPSRYETFPMSVIEACACSTPVIVTDRCGIAESIDGNTGIAVPYDEDRLANAIMDMLNDDDKRREYGENGISLVKDHFNWQLLAARIEQLYSSILAKTGK